MKIRTAAFLLATVAALSIAIATPVVAAPSPALAKALSGLRNLSDSLFENVVRWAHSGATRPSTLGRPSISISKEEWVESDILNLPDPGRRAVLDWLRSGSRAALYARGATDSEIGSRNPRRGGPESPPTPNPYRSLEFGSATLGGAPVGKIAILNGWAAVKRDGRGAHACISFKNVGSITATRVLIEFPIMDDAGAQLGRLEMDRRGTFSPEIDINGWDSLESWQRGSNRGYDENCTGINMGVAAFPLLAARFASYRILRVEYADGSVWTPAPAP
jgi:hypothetical protein